MHEMSLVINFVDIAKDYALRANAAKVEKVVLQVGELTGAETHYLEMFYPVVIEGTILEGSALVIEPIEASVFCIECGTTYNPCKTALKCPSCSSEKCDIIDGRQMYVKEIAVVEGNCNE